MVSSNALDQADVDEALIGVHTRALKFLGGGEAVGSDTDVALIRAELGALGSRSEPQRLALATVQDAGLRDTAKRENAAAAWCIADLILLAATNAAELLSLSDASDPSGIFAPFVANAMLTSVQLTDGVRALSATHEYSRLVAVGAILFRLLSPALHGIQSTSGPRLSMLASAGSDLTVVVGSLFRSIAFWQRMSSALPSQLAHLKEWLQAEHGFLADALRSASNINEVVRRSGEFDVFVLSILAECEQLGILGTAAARRSRELAEKAFYARFRSVLDSPFDGQDAFSSHFRDFEFRPLLDSITAVGIDPYKFRLTFDGFASDEYWRLIAKAAQPADRKRAIILVALAAITAARRRESELLIAARECARLLSTQRSDGYQSISGHIAAQTEDEAGIRLPLL